MNNVDEKAYLVFNERKIGNLQIEILSGNTISYFYYMREVLIHGLREDYDVFEVNTHERQPLEDLVNRLHVRRRSLHQSE